MSEEVQVAKEEVVEVVEQPVVQEPLKPSEEAPIITSKQKNPKNVAAGKLGALSKAAKKKQMQRMEEQSSSSYTSYAIVLLGVSVLSFSAYKFLFPRRKEEDFRKVHVEEEDSPPKGKKRGAPISMFD